MLRYISSTTQMALLAVVMSLVCAKLASGAGGVRVELTRIHSPGPGMTASQLVRDALRRDMHRHKARQLSASSCRTVSAPTRKDLPDGGSYLMILGIGTPPLPFPAVADTGSNLIWTQCAPCGSQCFKQPTPLYNPARSPTFRALPCSAGTCPAAGKPSPPPGSACPYKIAYGTGWTSGYLGCETFTFGFGSAPAHQARVTGIAFGCSNANSKADWIGSAGLAGLGRGNLSLASQLGAGRFSYCLTPFQDANSTSTLLFGPSAALSSASGAVRSTPFVASPSNDPMSSYYYLNLTGISLGTAVLSIPPGAFSLKADGTGGFVIDSGTTFTVLADAAYQQIRAAVLSLVTMLPTTYGSAASGGLDLCFALPSPTSAPPAMPSMTLHFDRADMVLPPDNYMVLVSDSSLWCLALQNQSNGGVSLLGNYQQQNMHILYDVAHETLSFAPAKCSTL